MAVVNIGKDLDNFLVEIVKNTLENDSVYLNNTDLINGLEVQYKPDSRLDFRKPIVLATSRGNLRIFQLLLENGANLDVKDINGCNIFHAIVLGTNGNEHYMCKAYRKIVQIIHNKTGNLELVKKLLRDEDDKQFRPLETAAEFCKFKLFLKILNTKNVYRFEYKVCGLNIHYKYLIGDYLLFGERNIKSPLLKLHHLSTDENKDNELTRIAFFQQPIIEKWKYDKFWLCFVLFFLYCAIPLYTMIAILIPDLEGDGILYPTTDDYENDAELCSITNNSKWAETSKNWSTTYRSWLYYDCHVIYPLSIISCIIYLIQLLLFYPILLSKRSYNLLKEMYEIFVDCIIFDAIELIGISFLIASIMVAKNIGNYQIYDEFWSYIQVPLIFLTVYTFIFILRHFPKLDTYFIAILGMTRAMLRFLFALVITFLCFSLGYWSAAQAFIGTAKDLFDFTKVLVTNFHFILNMVEDPTKDFENSNIRDFLNFYHIVFVMVIQVLAFNLLIAVMVNVYNKIEANMEVKKCINLLILKTRVTCWLYAICKIINIITYKKLNFPKSGTKFVTVRVPIKGTKK